MFGHWTEWMVHPRGRDKGVAVLEAYCDESGIHRGAPHCVVAGFVGSSKQWQLFEERWAKASGGVMFHGRRFHSRDENGSRVGPYRGWSDDQADAYLSGLLGAILNSAITPVGAVVDMKAFRALSLAERRYVTGAAYSPAKRKWTFTGAPATPYFCGFTCCIGLAAARLKKPGWKVHYFFDRQEQYAKHALRYFQRAVNQAAEPLRSALGEIAFKDKETVGGLQAADLLANACYSRASKRVGMDPILDKITEQLAKISGERIMRLDDEGLREYLTPIPDGVRDAWSE